MNHTAGNQGVMIIVSPDIFMQEEIKQSLWESSSFPCQVTDACGYTDARGYCYAIPDCSEQLAVASSAVQAFDEDEPTGFWDAYVVTSEGMIYSMGAWEEWDFVGQLREITNGPAGMPKNPRLTFTREYADGSEATFIVR